MNWEELKKLPEWVQAVHAACEKLNSACLSVGASEYPKVAKLRDDAEAIWLDYAAKSVFTINSPSEV